MLTDCPSSLSRSRADANDSLARNRRDALMELLRALAAFAERPGPHSARIADALGLARAPDAAEYTDVFVFQLYPYASVYLSEDGMLGGDARDRIGGFWRALQFNAPGE